MSDAQRLSAMCCKTKLCRFNLLGSCAKGKACRFAHGQEDMRPMPDLHRTRLCPALIKAGACGEVDCAFAHSREELRVVARQNGRRRDHTTSGGAELTACVVTAWQASQEPLDFSNSFVRAETVSTTDDGSSLLGSDDSGFNRQWTAESVPPSGLSTLEANEGVQLDGSDDKNCSGAEIGARRPGQNKFHKTKLCKFHMSGRCRKRGGCDFAHSPEEMQPLPDLFCTKLCPMLLSGGECHESACSFAHSEAELRRVGLKDMEPERRAQHFTSERPQLPAPQDRGAQGGQVASATSPWDVPGFAAQSSQLGTDLAPSVELDTGFSRQATEDPGQSLMALLRVKNTFLHFDAQGGIQRPSRRCKSAPFRAQRRAPKEAGAGTTVVSSLSAMDPGAALELAVPRSRRPAAQAPVFRPVRQLA
mmetsp:Transcript_29986/g.95733  ORF Transcript_29986/g.95733 Transcript_29986/m.95733 type:complete len:419 (-) Transcript_29986:387-1643(-)